MKIWIITDPELGWDCIVAVFLKEKDAKKHMKINPGSWVLHDRYALK